MFEDEQFRIQVSEDPFSRNYKSHRKQIVCNLFDMGKKLRQSLETIYLAIYYLDWVTYDYEVLEENFDLFSVCCLLLASKYDELDLSIPMIIDLLRCSKFPLSYDCVKQCEGIILKMLNWNLFQFSHYQVCKTLLAMGVVFEMESIVDENTKELRKVNERDVKKVQKYIEYICEIVA
jgi:hypothetical protein